MQGAQLIMRLAELTRLLKLRFELQTPRCQPRYATEEPQPSPISPESVTKTPHEHLGMVKRFEQNQEFIRIPKQ